MGESTGIGWTDHTANFWWGCQRVSPGCEHCYAETLAVVRRERGGVRSAGRHPGETARVATKLRAVMAAVWREMEGR